LAAALLGAAGKRGDHRHEQQRIGEADDPEPGERDRPSKSQLFQPAARQLPGQWDDQRDLGADREQPHPPGEHPQLPPLGAADECEQQLKGDHERDRGRGLPA
jgi:hypothetical protein